MTEENKALAVIPADAYAVTKTDGLVEALADAFENQGATVWNLTQLRVPAGGATVWSINTLTGEENPKGIEGVLALVKGRQRAWWRDEVGAGDKQPPNCESHDGLIGFGDPSLDQNTPGRHECASCRWSQFRSDRKGGKGQDCNQVARIFLFRPSSRLPIHLNVPAASLKNLTRYQLDLIDSGRVYHAVVTRLKLQKVTNAAGKDYSQIVFEFVGDLAPDAAKRVAELKRSLEAATGRVVSLRPEDVRVVEGTPTAASVTNLDDLVIGD